MKSVFLFGDILEEDTDIKISFLTIANNIKVLPSEK